MEDTLRAARDFADAHNMSVLILVVMEDTLRDPSRGCRCRSGIVLILVVMEDTLRVTHNFAYSLSETKS